jgi:GxGYxY sequence motif in domain of unknown function N-terminal/GxGYxYP putative glycoside hydrolase C-terminal domain
MHSASRPRKGRRLRVLGLLAVLAIGLVAGSVSSVSAAALDRGQGRAPSTALWPRFSTPRAVEAVDVRGLTPADRLAAVTLEGVYNAAQQPSRLYVTQLPDDQFWLTQIPNGIQVTTLTPGPQETVLQMLLKRYRRFIAGAIETNPSNPDTVNLATTMAGIDHAVVIAPSQESVVRSLGIHVLYSFNTPTFTGYNVVQTYQWGVQHLLPRTSTRILTMLFPTDTGDIRDYSVATGSFIFWLTSTDAAQKPVMNTIIEHTPANTPIMGYIPHEGPDVADLSSLGHFLNASDFLRNASVWASMPSPSSLHETQPAPIAAQPNTVYVAFLVSDGDNAQYMQHRMTQVWQGPYLGSVPEGWTVAPAAVEFAPTVLQYLNSHLPSNSEFDAGPSGIGYATQTPASPPADLVRFGQLSGEIMRRTGIGTVDTWENLNDLHQFAAAAGVPSISVGARLAYEQLGHTAVFGQTSGYVNPPRTLFCTLDQQSASEQPGKPLFLEPLIDGWNYTPADVLNLAQQLALSGQATGRRYVFTTPTELALTMERYYQGKEQGLPAGNAQSMTGDQVLAEPRPGPSFPSGPVQVTGANLVTNPSGASGTAGWSGGPNSANATLSATTYQGGPALHWTDTITGQSDWVHYYPAVQNGQTYTFSVELAGSGQVYLNVWTGTTDVNTVPINLTSTYQRFTWTATIPTNAPTGQTNQAPQLQVREAGAGPVSAYIRNASVAASTSPC